MTDELREPDVHESDIHIGQTSLILAHLGTIKEGIKDARDELTHQIDRVEADLSVKITRVEDQAKITNGRITALERIKLVHDGMMLAANKLTPFLIAGFGGAIGYALSRLFG